MAGAEGADAAADVVIVEAARGRVLWPGEAAPAGGAAVRSPKRLWVVFALMSILPMFAGLFVYVVDVKPLYALAKAWALLMLPVAVFGVWRLELPYRPLVIMTAVWLLAVTPFVGMLVLGNDAVGAFASSVKVWPVTGAFSAALALSLLKPEPERIEAAVIVLALATFGFLIVAWLLAPDAWFQQGIEDTKVFLSDPERGRRINAPMMFGILGLFLLNRSFWARKAVWKAVAIVAGLAVMVLIYKQRAQTGGGVVVLGLGAILSWGRMRGSAIALAAAAAVALAVPLLMWIQHGAADSLGGSLSMRQIEAEHALRFLNDAPWRWVLGVGSATRIGDVTMGDIVGTPFFFPSDLGWLGVMFEYGAIGAGLMLALHVAAVRLTWSAAEAGGPLQAAVFDYSVFLIVVSPVVSVVLSPGELATVLALGWWLGRGRAQGVGVRLRPRAISRRR